MFRTHRLFCGLFASFCLLASSPLYAAEDGSGHDHAGHDHAAHDHAAHDHGSAEQAGHVEAGHGQVSGDHGGHHADHVPHFSDINWFHGMIGEKEGVEPSFLWRAPGTPVPLGALLLNSFILFFLIIRFGGPGIRQGLIDRKQRIAGDIERASKMKAEAENQLAFYEEKLATVAAEMTRIKKEMQEEAELDRQRILADARTRRAALEQETRALIAQELAEARYEATLKAVSSAVAGARDQIVKNKNPEDEDRLAKNFLSSLETEVKKAVEVRS